MNRFILFLLATAFFLFSGCHDDYESNNEVEVITTFIVTLARVTPAPQASDTVTLNWDDVNLDAIVDASEVITNGALLSEERYSASIKIFNKNSDSEINITEEITKEAQEHIFCFTLTDVSISITNQDEDKNGLPLGVTSTWTTTTSVGTGTVNIKLRHQPGVKTGDCPGAGETDVDITFAVSVDASSE